MAMLPRILCKPDSSLFPPIIVTKYTAHNFPVSIYYQAYTDVGVGREYYNDVKSGPMAISLGIMNGSAKVDVKQGEQSLLSEIVIGQYFNYVVISASNSYCFVNFLSNGQSLHVSISTISGRPIIAYNLYNNYITDYTASLITYPPSFTLNLGPRSTPVNTGLSFLIVAPDYTQPTPLAILAGEGFTDKTTGKSWWAQIGFNNWAGDMNKSYASWGISSNIFGNPGGTDTNHQLVPGDTYNFTMALVSDTTWEFVVNGTRIQAGSFSGLFNTTSSVSDEGAGLSIETFTAWGGNVNITSQIVMPVVMRFLVDGQWSEPSSFEFRGVDENWWNGNATVAPGIDLWGIAGHLQDPNVPDGSLFFNNSLPMPMDIPGIGLEPIYGNYSYPQTQTGEAS